MPKSADSCARYLWILRHGKAASDPPWGGTDRERPLTARGRRDATALGARLASPEPFYDLESIAKPELIICSSAVRTRQTADLVADAMGGQLPLDSYLSLYQADTDVVFQYLREIDEGVKSTLLVGHNPTMFQLAWALLGESGPVDDERVDDEAVDDERVDQGEPSGDRGTLEASGFPTCALAVLDLGVSAWEDVVHGCGSLLGIFKPPY